MKAASGGLVLSLGNTDDKAFDFDFFTKDELAKPKSNLVNHQMPS